MASADQIQSRMQSRQIDALEKLRKLRRDKAELEVAVARHEEAMRRAERLEATAARLRAFSRLDEWKEQLSHDSDVARARSGPTMSQPVFEFDRLSSQLRREEFAEFAAQRREVLAAERVASVVAVAKAAATTHEKIVECLK